MASLIAIIVVMHATAGMQGRGCAP